MSNQDKIEQLINTMIHSLTSLKNELSANPAPTPTVSALAEPLTIPAASDDLDLLKKALFSDKWPEAVNPNLLCDPSDEMRKIERGRGVIELFVEDDLQGVKILDFGCGEGHSALAAAQAKAQLAVGYDIVASTSWLNHQETNLLLTDKIDKVQENGPYNIILLFDVLDHLQNDLPVDVLKLAKSLLAPNGKIFVHCHPYISRHATHLYHDLNKAFVHLVFTEDELRSIVPNSKHEQANIGVTYPLKTYHDYFVKAGLKEVNKRETVQKVEPFFKIPKIAERIMRNTGHTSFPEFQMSLQFVDYTLIS